MAGGAGTLGLLEYGLRSPGNAASEVLGSFSNRLPEDGSPGLASALETGW